MILLTGLKMLKHLMQEVVTILLRSLGKVLNHQPLSLEEMATTN